MTTPQDRYAGKPFLRLLDCYFLSVIGELEDGQQRALAALEPKFRRTFGQEGTWTEIVEKQMEFDATIRDQVRQLWAGYLDHCTARNLVPNAKDFILRFVNDNFPFVK